MQPRTSGGLGGASRHLHEAPLLSVEGERHPTVDVQLAVDVVEMDLHGAFADEQPRGDLLVAKAGGHQAHDLELTCGQVERELARGDLPAQQLLEEPSDRALLDPGLAAVHLANALEQERRGHLLQDHAAHAEADGLADLILLERRAEQDDAGGKVVALQLPDHGQSILPGQPEIEDEDVGPMRPDRAHRVFAVGAAREDGELLAPEELLETVERDGMAVGENEPDRLRCGDRMGQYGRSSTSRFVTAFTMAMSRSPSISSEGPGRARAPLRQ